MGLIRQAALRDQVADELRAMILKGEIPSGTELKQDHLAQKFGVSRIPVREALLLLARDGLVTVKANRRVVVAAMTDEWLIDHYAVRALVEAEAASRAATRANVDTSAITAAEEQSEAAWRSGDRAAYLTASEVFHRAVWAAAGGPHLLKLAEELWSGRDYVPSYQAQLDRANHEHHMIAEAIRSHSPDKARQAMTEHINRTAEELISYRGRVSRCGPTIEESESSEDG